MLQTNTHSKSCSKPNPTNNPNPNQIKELIFQMTEDKKESDLFLLLTELMLKGFTISYHEVKGEGHRNVIRVPNLQPGQKVCVFGFPTNHKGEYQNLGHQPNQCNTCMRTYPNDLPECPYCYQKKS